MWGFDIFKMILETRVFSLLGEIELFYDNEDNNYTLMKKLLSGEIFG